jgi:hypothetical protein
MCNLFILINTPVRHLNGVIRPDKWTGLFRRQDYFKNCASPFTGKPPSARAFFIADTSVFSSSNQTVTQWFFVSVLKFETPSTPFRIELTLAAVPGQTHPGTVNFTILSPANKNWEVVKTNTAARISTNTICFFFKISALLEFYLLLHSLPR